MTESGDHPADQEAAGRPQEHAEPAAAARQQRQARGDQDQEQPLRQGPAPRTEDRAGQHRAHRLGRDWHAGNRHGDRRKQGERGGQGGEQGDVDDILGRHHGAGSSGRVQWRDRTGSLVRYTPIAYRVNADHPHDPRKGAPMGIRFDAVRQSFDGRDVLSDLSLTLAERRIGVIGANGSGKSSFARLINGLSLPTDGRVTVDGLDTPP